MKILLHSDAFSEGKLFAISNGKRTLLSDCTITIESYETHTQIPILGKSKAVKKTRNQQLICGDNGYTRLVDEDFLASVSRFEVVYDQPREDGIFERVVLDNITLLEIDACDRWIFDA